jgi:hypothetical protein
LQGLPFGKISIPLLNIKVHDNEFKEVAYTPQFLSFPSGDRLENRALIFLNEIVPPERCPITLKMSFDHEMALHELRHRGADASRSQHRLDALETDRIWLLATPPNWPLAFTDLLDPQQSDFPEAWQKDLQQMRAAWTHGTPLDDDKARAYFTRFVGEQLVEGAQISGWRVPVLPVGSFCGFTVRRRILTS